MGEIDPPPVDDPETAALAMVAMVERFSFYSVIQIRPLDREAMLDTLATILHNGLFGGSRRRAARLRLPAAHRPEARRSRSGRPCEFTDRRGRALSAGAVARFRFLVDGR